MVETGFLSPSEIAAATVRSSVAKAGLGPLRQFLLGILGGAFIAFASEGSNMAAFNLLAAADTYGLGKAMAGAIFGTGLMLVLVAGAELFTGNALMLAGVLQREIRLRQMLVNWLFVYLGNFAGSLLVAWLMVASGLFSSGGGLLGGITIRIAAAKTSLAFGPAFILGLLCNWLVCLAVWMAAGARDLTGKFLAVFFPIWLFITSGFEHSIANMYYIPAGILAKANPAWAAASQLDAARLDGLSWRAFLFANLLPVTLGNIAGGCLMVAGAYWLIYLRQPAILMTGQKADTPPTVSPPAPRRASVEAVASQRSVKPAAGSPHGRRG